MSSPSDATIIPITLSVNDRTGITLWAPPWEDDEGEEWQGFLGDGAKILLFPNTRELALFIASGEENDLSDHPAWGRVLKLTASDLQPTSNDAYDLDGVYEWAAAEPDPVHVSALANVVDMVGKIADCCDDGALRSLIENTPEYVELVSDDVSYQGRDGRRAWTQLGDIVAESWERALTRVASWLSWRGDFSESEELIVDSVWDRIGAEPIELVLPDATYLTVRGEEGEDVLFLGDDGNVAVFTEVADLARYCRVATDHDLARLEWWSELNDVSEADEADIFTPEEGASFDLRTPSPDGAELLRELADYCDLEGDLADLDEPFDPTAWNAFVAEVQTCLQLQD
jgi:hypothetical protein